jgi:hypothetical protein
MALPCVPFVVLTLGYLALRYALFGEVAREGLMTSERLGLFLGDASAHLRRMIVGDEARLAAWPAAAPVLGVAAAVVVAGRRLPRGRAGQLARSAVYFGVIWVGLGLAPTIVAGYASPRHMYLASVGWAILLAAAVDVLWEARRPIWRFAGLALAVLALAGYAFRLAVEVRAWEVRTDVSRRAVADLEREALAAPEGSLLIAGAPARSWNFALPFAARPPFARVDLTRRATIVSDSSLHCCPAHLWNAYTRSALAAWLADPRRPPVVGLFWDPDTGALSRVSDREEPFLRQVVAYWIATPDAAALDLQIRDTLERLVAGRRRD